MQLSLQGGTGIAPTSVDTFVVATTIVTPASFFSLLADEQAADAPHDEQHTDDSRAPLRNACEATLRTLTLTPVTVALPLP